MERTAVTSTMIRSVGYDPETRTLEIEFNSGGAVWSYAEFPPDLHEAFMKASSLGKFFLAHIKNQYPGSKL